MKTTYRDFGKDGCETREHDRSATVSQFGRSYCYITCPFCTQTVTAYIWSLAGGCKRCPCGALHDNCGRTFKMHKH